MMIPIGWTLSTSLKTEGDYFAFPPKWIPSKPTLEHYAYLFFRTDGFRALKSTLTIAIFNTLIVMLLSIPTAYAIARFRVGGKNLSLWILSQRMLPPIAVAVPIFLLFVKARLVDTHVGLIIMYCLFNIPFAVWLLIGFFQDFPLEIEEAALIDGCSRPQALMLVVFPLLAPAIAVVALFVAVFAWNEFLFAFVLTRSKVKTWMILISSFQSPQNILWGEAAAAAIIGFLPGFIFVLSLRKYLVRGLTMGGIR